MLCTDYHAKMSPVVNSDCEQFNFINNIDFCVPLWPSILSQGKYLHFMLDIFDYILAVHFNRYLNLKHNLRLFDITVDIEKYLIRMSL